jgi:hypothetical protein
MCPVQTVTYVSGRSLAALQRNGLAVLPQFSTFNIRLIKGQTEIPQY